MARLVAAYSLTETPFCRSHILVRRHLVALGHLLTLNFCMGRKMTGLLQGGEHVCPALGVYSRLLWGLWYWWCRDIWDTKHSLKISVEVFGELVECILLIRVATFFVAHFIVERACQSYGSLRRFVWVYHCHSSWKLDAWCCDSFCLGRHEPCPKTEWYPGV